MGDSDFIDRLKSVPVAPVLPGQTKLDTPARSPSGHLAKDSSSPFRITNLLEGKGIQIVRFSEDSEECIFDHESLRSILDRDEYRSKPIIIISIVGPTSSGKTSFENYCFRYMERSSKGVNWMASADDEPLLGLDWRPTMRTTTRGIWIWDRPYLVKGINGVESVVLFMDTEGLYGKDEVRGRWSHVFGISTAASSIQIFNLKEELTPRDMEELQVFVRLAEMSIKCKEQNTGGGSASTAAALSGSRKRVDYKLKPFQRLWFLIRSWRYPEDYDYGEKGGCAYLDDVFKSKESDKKHLKEMKDSIINSYGEIYCYLMPHPNDIIYRPSYVGQIGPLCPEFKHHLNRFISHLLDPMNLQPKEILGIPLTCGRYVDFFSSIIDTFNNGSFPKIDSLMMAITLATKNQLIDHFSALYEEMLKCELDLVLDKCRPRARGRILTVFRITQNDVMEMFDNHPKFFTTEESNEVKGKIVDCMKIVRERVNTAYGSRFVEYYNQLYEQQLLRFFTERLVKMKLKHIDPQYLVELHSRLKTRIMAEIYSMTEFGLDKEIKNRLRRELDARFVKFSRTNEELVETDQTRKVKYASVSAGGGVLGITSGSIAAHSVAVAATASAVVGIVAGGLIVVGIGAVGASSYLGYKWFKTKKSKDLAKKNFERMLPRTDAFDEFLIV